MEIRRGEQRDAEAVRSIYNKAVLESTVTFDLVARSSEEQRRWMEEHDGVYPVLVAVEDDDVIGFASLSPYRPRPAYATSVEDSIYVAEDHRGAGVGKALLFELVRLAGAHGFHAVMARIVDDHEASIALHRSCGFAVIGVEREVGRKFGRWLDVAVMQRLL